MKIKTTILFTVFLGVGAYLGYMPKTITANNIDRKSNTSYVNATTYCPVVGSGTSENLSQSYQDNNNDAPIYKHCVKCNTGVYLLRKEENLISKCSFCDALEEGFQTISFSGE